MKDDRAYSTTVDALLFLVMVSACAVILSPVIMGHSMERASTDRNLRELATAAIVTMETEKVDYFEYRILGDVADQIATYGGINATNDFLYKEITRSVLGRGSRHRTVMDLAAEDAACQFVMRYGNDTLRLNPLTTEYDQQIRLLVDKAVRSRVDQRFGYEFTLRWMPFAGVPLEGSVTAGRPHPPGAMSIQTFVTMPYTTKITMAGLRNLNEPDLASINESIVAYRSDNDSAKLQAGIHESLQRCLANSTRAEVQEIWGNTLGSPRAEDRRIDPASALEAFSTNPTSADTHALDVRSMGEDAIVQAVVFQNRDSLNALAASCAAEIVQNGSDYPAIEQKILSWLLTRYEPSRARVTMSVWVGG
ncbi:DUF7284 family protein [Methanocella arvoryzae]|uniref:Uncharacterized protein n=1 Tax=Methanocella arvoryzae (strain DSM 22066 / NBRC 105507 / MRE50) TaxID=351160 RepID=Q0W757_METAR|nr:hypothetical protein [Methanocella arvoryzae]CAJ35786.1 hypothetical protein RCIX328 [Methanocella arvoryzae MRE50]